jgi:ABC-2 type transport system permease protein
VFVVLAVSVGSRAIATEEEQRTLDLLMAQPVWRRGVATEKYGAVVLVTVTVGVASWIVLAISSALAGLAAGLGDLAVATAASVLFGLLSGALAFGVGAVVGRRAPAVAAAAVVAVMGSSSNRWPRSSTPSPGPMVLAVSFRQRQRPDATAYGC